MDAPDLSTLASAPAVRLACGFQTYAWGLVGKDSPVAAMAAGGNPDGFAGAEVSDDTPFAELWMGTHDACPSYVVDPSNPDSRTLFRDAIAADPEAWLGEAAAARFGGDLPFLFKVLGVGRALSIQAHPDKELAESLHAARPDVYRDANHKPEMAIAVTPFEALCGFRPIAEVAAFVVGVDQLRALCGGDEAAAALEAAAAGEGVEHGEASAGALKAAFSALMKADAEVVKAALDALVGRLANDGGVPGVDAALAALILRLHTEFPGDVGVFCPFFLNHLTMDVGEAVFLGPCLPHAYLSGTCIECMATSNNVVRAGLTPKLRDVDTLCEMLRYTGAPAADQLLAPVVIDAATTSYQTPVPEFDVERIAVGAGDAVVLAERGPSVLLVVDGTGRLEADGGVSESVGRGSVWSIKPKASVTLSADAQGDGMSVYRAHCTL